MVRNVSIQNHSNLSLILEIFRRHFDFCEFSSYYSLSLWDHAVYELFLLNSADSGAFIFMIVLYKSAKRHIGIMFPISNPTPFSWRGMIMASLHSSGIFPFTTHLLQRFLIISNRFLPYVVICFKSTESPSKALLFFVTF